MARRAPRTLLEVCVARAGMAKGARIAEFVITWAIATDALGHEPTVEEVAEWWRERTPRTLYRRLHDFRAAFPEFGPDGFPTAFAAALLADADTLKDRGRAVFAPLDLRAAGLAA